MNFRSLVISSVLITLFVVSAIYFSYFFSVNNSTSSLLTNDDRVSRAYGNMSIKLVNFSAEAKAQREGLGTETRHPILTTIGFVFTSILNAGIVYLGMVVGTFNILFILSEEVLGISSVVTGAIMTIILIVLVLGAWRVYRSGE